MGNEGAVKIRVTLIALSRWLLLLSIVACSSPEGAPREAAQGPERLVTLPAPVVMEGSDDLPARLSEYALLHQEAARDRDIPLHLMSAAAICPE
jgi:hypothetical protein